MAILLAKKLNGLYQKLREIAKNRQKDTACERLNLLDKRQLPR